MSKQILPHELAEIVAGLLINPTALGELDHLDTYHSFIRDIGQVVADYCGGEINGVNEGDGPEALDDNAALPSLSVSPNDSLPSLENNIWSFHDTEGWDEETSIESQSLSERISSKIAIRKQRSFLQGLIGNKGLAENIEQTFNFRMIDWLYQETKEVNRKGDNAPYCAHVSLGNQTYIDLIDQDENPQLGVILEIDNGVPTLHISTKNDDPCLHIHSAQGGLVLTPDTSSTRFEKAEKDRFSYHDHHSLVIREPNKND